MTALVNPSTLHLLAAFALVVTGGLLVIVAVLATHEFTAWQRIITGVVGCSLVVTTIIASRGATRVLFTPLGLILIAVGAYLWIRAVAIVIDKNRLKINNWLPCFGAIAFIVAGFTVVLWCSSHP